MAATRSNKISSEEKIRAWLAGEWDGLSGYQVNKIIRKYLIKRAGEKCELCGWAGINVVTGNLCLEIHHKDGNYKNNTIDNLQVLCPNCHSMTPTYRNANPLKNRTDRHKYSANYKRTTPEERKTRKENTKSCKQEIKIKKHVHTCPMCGAPCLNNTKYCSRRCASKATSKIDWDSVNIAELLKTNTVASVARRLNISDSAVLKRMKTAGIENPRSRVNLRIKKIERDRIRAINREKTKPVPVACVETNTVFKSKNSAAVWTMRAGYTRNKSTGSVKKAISQVIDKPNRSFHGLHFITPAHIKTLNS